MYYECMRKCQGKVGLGSYVWVGWMERALRIMNI